MWLMKRHILVSEFRYIFLEAHNRYLLDERAFAAYFSTFYLTTELEFLKSLWGLSTDEE
jgi:hypothetical protein